jgi:hypothetical protein
LLQRQGQEDFGTGLEVSRIKILSPAKSITPVSYYTAAKSPTSSSIQSHSFCPHNELHTHHYSDSLLSGLIRVQSTFLRNPFLATVKNAEKLYNKKCKENASNSEVV